MFSGGFFPGHLDVVRFLTETWKVNPFMDDSLDHIFDPIHLLRMRFPILVVVPDFLK